MIIFISININIYTCILRWFYIYKLVVEYSCLGDWFVGKNHFFAVANTKESRKDEKYRCFLKNREDDYYLGASITPQCNSIKTVEKVRNEHFPYSFPPLMQIPKWPCWPEPVTRHLRTPSLNWAKTNYLLYMILAWFPFVNVSPVTFSISLFVLNQIATDVHCTKLCLRNYTSKNCPEYCKIDSWS